METPKIVNKNQAAAKAERYIFDEFEVDPANRTFSCAGVAIPITAKVFDILLVFVKNPGRLLEKDEFLEKVWHEDFVEEGNLARNVSTLRTALANNGNERNYIVTVRGHGYRFEADVSRIGTAGIGQASEGPAAVAGIAPHRKRAWLVAIAALILVAAIVLLLGGGFPLRRNVAAIDIDNLRQTKLTQDGNVVSPTISPDGRYLAYVCPDDNGHGICVRQADTGSVLRVVKSASGVERWAASISPDSKYVYYVSRDEGVEKGRLYRVPILGGAPKMLTENVHGYSLSPDGSKLVLFRDDRTDRTSALVAADSEAQNETVLLSAELDSAVFSLAWSPDGESILYSIRRPTADGVVRYVAEVPAAGGSEQHIPNPSGAKIGAIRWMPGKQGFIGLVVDEATNLPQLYHISYPEGELSRLTNDVNGHNSFSLTADGRTIVTDDAYDNRQVWVSGQVGSIGLRPVTSDTEKHFDIVNWAGNQFLVTDEDERSGYRVRSIWRMRPDGSDRQRLTNRGYNAEPTVSPDGQNIVFVSDRGGKSQLWRMRIDGEELVQLTGVAYNISSPEFSENGNSVFFRAWVDGVNTVWHVPAGGGEASQIVSGVDIETYAVAPDGSQIAFSYFDTEAKRLRTQIRSLNGKFADRYMEFVPETWMTWSRDGRSIYFNRAADSAKNVWRQELNGGDPTPITNFTEQRVFRCSWSHDGSGMACIRQQITFDALMIGL